MKRLDFIIAAMVFGLVAGNVWADIALNTKAKHGPEFYKYSALNDLYAVSIAQEADYCSLYLGGSQMMGLPVMGAVYDMHLTPAHLTPRTMRFLFPHRRHWYC